jgi:hypothetical protein
MAPWGICGWIHTVWKKLVNDPRECRSQELDSRLGLPQRGTPENQLAITGPAESAMLMWRILDVGRSAASGSLSILG